MKTATSTFVKTLAPAVALLAGSMAMAGSAPSAADIKAAVSDHTYQGSMATAGSGFSEFYAANGEIRGDGYSGKWRVEDGIMCFQYGADPESCWGIELQGPSMVLLKEGQVDGNGMLIPGNENGY